MGLIKFLTSKVFFKQLLIAALALLIIVFFVLKWLNVYTHHNTFEVVPDLKGKSVDVAKIELDKNNLVMVVYDSVNYNPNYPPKVVIEQNPIAGIEVKENRKIYLSLNPSGYRKIKVPDLTEQTFRQVKPTLEALGFKVGTVTYIDNIGKDVVLKMKYKGEVIPTGTLLPQTAEIDLVLGNGNRSSEE